MCIIDRSLSEQSRALSSVEIANANVAPTVSHPLSADGVKE